MIDKIKTIDIKVINSINKNRLSFLEKIMIFFTRIGDAGILWGIIAIILFLNKNYNIAIKMSLSLLLSAAFGNLVLKPLFERNRPYKKYPELRKLDRKLKDYSFPSGHSITSFASATVLFGINLYIGLIFVLIAFLISFSRIYLNMHYLSDVIFGIIFGVLIGLFILTF